MEFVPLLLGVGATEIERRKAVCRSCLVRQV